MINKAEKVPGFYCVDIAQDQEEDINHYDDS